MLYSYKIFYFSSIAATAGNIEDMKRKHNFEIERLEKKIKWYAENQELLDRDATELRKAKEEIRELRDIIERLEKSEKKLKSDRDNKSKEKTSDAKRIQDLEIQVKGKLSQCISCCNIKYL